MTQDLSQKAIDLALKQQWNDAVDVNQEILNQKPNDLDALKRIAYAYLHLGNIKNARTHYHTVLKHDRHNPVATKALKRLENLPSSQKPSDITPQLADSAAFLEEPGKTKTVQMVHLAENSVLCNLVVGQRVVLRTKKRCIEARDTKGTYLGALPDDLSYRIIQLLHGGNEYEAFVKEVNNNRLAVFIREAKRGKKFRNIPSFTGGLPSSYTPFVHRTLIKEDTLDVTTLEEKEDELA